jgi:hypothetical protein
VVLAALDGRAEAAAVRAMTSGSQHRTVSADGLKFRQGASPMSLRAGRLPLARRGLGALHGLPARRPALCITIAAASSSVSGRRDGGLATPRILVGS